MTVAAQNQIIEKALALPKNSRERLLRRLQKSLQTDEEDISAEEWNESWKAELEKRIADVKSGKVKCIPVEVARKQWDKMFKRS